MSEMLFDTLFPEGFRKAELLTIESRDEEVLAKLFRQLDRIDLRRREDKETVHVLLGEIDNQVVTIKEVE